MTRSERDVIADMLSSYIAREHSDSVDDLPGTSLEEADRILSRLSEEGWVVVPRANIGTDLGSLNFDTRMYTADEIDAMLAAIDRKEKG